MPPPSAPARFAPPARWYLRDDRGLKRGQTCILDTKRLQPPSATRGNVVDTKEEAIAATVAVAVMVVVMIAAQEKRVEAPEEKLAVLAVLRVAVTIAAEAKKEGVPVEEVEEVNDWHGALTLF